MKSAGKTNTFLMELILVILFFSLSAAITLQLFVTAHSKSVLSRDQTMAMLQAENLIEQVKASESGALPYFDAQQGNSYRIFFNDNWEQSNSGGPYELIVFTEKSSAEYGAMLNMTVKVNKGEQKLCELASSVYLPEEEAAQ